VEGHLSEVNDNWGFVGRRSRLLLLLMFITTLKVKESLLHSILENKIHISLVSVFLVAFEYLNFELASQVNG